MEKSLPELPVDTDPETPQPETPIEGATSNAAPKIGPGAPAPDPPPVSC